MAIKGDMELHLKRCIGCAKFLVFYPLYLEEIVPRHE